MNQNGDGMLNYHPGLLVLVKIVVAHSRVLSSLFLALWKSSGKNLFVYAKFELLVFENPLIDSPPYYTITIPVGGF